MNVILFTGSGVSLDSGHPDVVGLTKAVLNETGEKNEHIFLGILAELDTNFLRTGKNMFSDFHLQGGEDYRDFTSYEDLYYLCSELSNFDWGLHTNSIVSTFCNYLSHHFKHFINEQLAIDKKRTLGFYGHAGKKHIEQKVMAALGKTKKVLGFDLLLSMAKHPEIHSLDIITTNHDLLVEQLFAEHSIGFADGFGERDGDIRWFDHKAWPDHVKIKLIKLHGSVDWFKLIKNGSWKPGLVVINSLNQYRNDSGVIVNGHFELPMILSGLNKINWYNREFYTDIHHRFQKSLYEKNVVIMSGYGWGDEPINNRFEAWLDMDKNNKIILLHREPESLLKRTVVLDRNYETFIKSGKIISIKKWMSEISWEQIFAALP